MNRNRVRRIEEKPQGHLEGADWCPFFEMTELTPLLKKDIINLLTIEPESPTSKLMGQPW